MEPHGPGETETDYPRSFNSAPRLMRPRGYIRGRGQIETYEPRGATARRKRRWDRRARRGGGRLEWRDGGGGGESVPPNAWNCGNPRAEQPVNAVPGERGSGADSRISRFVNGKKDRTREESRANESIRARARASATGTTIAWGKYGGGGRKGETDGTMREISPICRASRSSRADRPLT